MVCPCDILLISGCVVIIVRYHNFTSLFDGITVIRQPMGFSLVEDTSITRVIQVIRPGRGLVAVRRLEQARTCTSRFFQFVACITIIAVVLRSLREDCSEDWTQGRNRASNNRKTVLSGSPQEEWCQCPYLMLALVEWKHNDTDR
jgi:hypothetical protein